MASLLSFSFVLFLRPVSLNCSGWLWLTSSLCRTVWSVTHGDLPVPGTWMLGIKLNAITPRAAGNCYEETYLSCSNYRPRRNIGYLLRCSLSPYPVSQIHDEKWGHYQHNSWREVTKFYWLGLNCPTDESQSERNLISPYLTSYSEVFSIELWALMRKNV